MKIVQVCGGGGDSGHERGQKGQTGTGQTDDNELGRDHGSSFQSDVYGGTSNLRSSRYRRKKEKERPATYIGRVDEEEEGEGRRRHRPFRAWMAVGSCQSVGIEI